MTQDDARETTTDVEQAVEQMNDRGTTVRTAQLEQALTQLRAGDELTVAQRQVVELLSERLVDQLLAVPRSSLREAADVDDEQTVETALELFG